MDKERNIQVSKYLAQNHTARKWWTQVSNQVSLLILTPFLLQQVFRERREESRRQRTQNKDSFQAEAGQGLTKEETLAPQFFSVSTPELTTLSFSLSSLSPQSSREFFRQLFYNGPKVLSAGGGLASLTLGQPKKLGSQSAFPLQLCPKHFPCCSHMWVGPQAIS